MINFYSFHIFCKLNSNANGNTIRDRKGNYYLWIYAKDSKGNEKIVPSR